MEPRSKSQSGRNKYSSFSQRRNSTVFSTFLRKNLNSTYYSQIKRSLVKDGLSQVKLREITREMNDITTRVEADVDVDISKIENSRESKDGGETGDTKDISDLSWDR